ALGCMRMSGLDSGSAARLISAACESGINYFDHADIYGGGKSESVFRDALKQAKIPRGDVFIQTKCGIKKGCFDYSKEHIISSAEQSLARLGTDYADALLLHRPDTLMEPEEVAEAFDRLHSSGKVRYFGVSNHNSGQIKLLGKYVRQPLIINQLQFSITNTGMIDSGLNVNMKNPPSVDHDGGLLEFCRIEGITIQPWSPFQHGFFEGTYIGNAKYKELNEELAKTAAEHGISVEAASIAWILRHPAKMQPIIGTTKPERVAEISKASEISLTREKWYSLYLSAGNTLP
ncbi:MAG: aldo/keto reductase, partial [Defluviitaleaceae bacterium]|nr:aldo/keto reductase [Defluviitaleaceae bacterium]